MPPGISVRSGSGASGSVVGGANAAIFRQALSRLPVSVRERVMQPSRRPALREALGRAVLAAAGRLQAERGITIWRNLELTRSGSAEAPITRRRYRIRRSGRRVEGVLRPPGFVLAADLAEWLAARGIEYDPEQNPRKRKGRSAGTAAPARYVFAFDKLDPGYTYRILRALRRGAGEVDRSRGWEHIFPRVLVTWRVNMGIRDLDPGYAPRYLRRNFDDLLRHHMFGRRDGLVRSRVWANEMGEISSSTPGRVVRGGSSGNSATAHRFAAGTMSMPGHALAWVLLKRPVRGGGDGRVDLELVVFDPHGEPTYEREFARRLVTSLRAAAEAWNRSRSAASLPANLRSTAVGSLEASLLLDESRGPRRVRSAAAAAAAGSGGGGGAVGGRGLSGTGERRRSARSSPPRPLVRRVSLHECRGVGPQYDYEGSCAPVSLSMMLALLRHLRAIEQRRAPLPRAESLCRVAYRGLRDEDVVLAAQLAIAA